MHKGVGRIITHQRKWVWSADRTHTTVANIVLNDHYVSNVFYSNIGEENIKVKVTFTLYWLQNQFRYTSINMLFTAALCLRVVSFPRPKN